MNKELKYILDGREILYKNDELLSKYTTFKIGGPCKSMFFPKNEKEILFLHHLLNQFNEKVFILGNGSNLLAKDEGFDGYVINLHRFYNKISIKNNLLKCDSGANLFKINKILMDKNLSNLEFTYGIPASIGGLVKMNGGAFQDEIGNYVESIRVLQNGKFETLHKKDLVFGYRKSNIEGTILEVNLNVKESKFSVRDKCLEFFKHRKETQPYNLPSAGSIFKRINGIIVSKEIDKLGLKGYTIGGASISTKHAGFIVNINNATYDDVKNLINHIKHVFYKEHKVELEEEIIYL